MIIFRSHSPLLAPRLASKSFHSRSESVCLLCFSLFTIFHDLHSLIPSTRDFGIFRYQFLTPSLTTTFFFPFFTTEIGLVQPIRLFFSYLFTIPPGFRLLFVIFLLPLLGNLFLTHDLFIPSSLR